MESRAENVFNNTIVLHRVSVNIEPTSRQECPTKDHNSDCNVKSGQQPKRTPSLIRLRRHSPLTITRPSASPSSHKSIDDKLQRREKCPTSNGELHAISQQGESEWAPRPCSASWQATSPVQSDLPGKQLQSLTTTDGQLSSATAVPMVTCASQRARISGQKPFVVLKSTSTVELKSEGISSQECRDGNNDELEAWQSPVPENVVIMDSRLESEYRGLSPSSSRTSTPTMVRSRPKLPSGLFKSSPKALEAGNTIAHLGTGVVSALGKTDFVRKYSRRGRSCGGSGASSPSTTIRSPAISPGLRSPPLEHGINRSPLTLSSNIKLKLERVKQNQDRENLSDDNVGVPRSEFSRETNPAYFDGEKQNSEDKSSSAISHGGENETIIVVTCTYPGTVFAENVVPLRAENLRESIHNGDPICVSGNRSHKVGTSSAPVCSVVSVTNVTSSPAEFPSSVPSYMNSEDQHLNATPNSGPHGLHCHTSMRSAGSSVGESRGFSNNSPVPQVKSAPNLDFEALARNSPKLKPMLSCESDTSSLSSHLKPHSSFDKESGDDVSLLSLHVTEDDDSGSLGSRKRPFKDSSIETEDEGVGATDIDGYTYKDAYTAVTRTATPTSVMPVGTLTISPASIPHISCSPASVCQNQSSEVELSSKGVDEISRRFQRLPDSGTTASGSGGKGTTGRFLTHPPFRDRGTSNKEAGSVDSNGLGSLRGDSLDPIKAGDLDSQASELSLDSHICPGETQDTISYRDVVLNVTSEGSTEVDKLERKNSKTMKQKSKSDPSGEKQKDSIDIPSVIYAHTQSTPMLSEERDTISSLPEFHRTDEDQRKSMSDNVLTLTEKEEQLSLQVPFGHDTGSHSGSTDESSDEESLAAARQKRRSSKKRQRGVSSERWETRERKADKIAKTNLSDSIIGNNESRDSRRHKTICTAPSTPVTQSPENTLTKASLTIPLRKGIIRSHSSASVLMQKAEPLRTITGDARTKEHPEAIKPKLRPNIQDHFGLSGNIHSSGGVVGSVPELSTPSSKTSRDRTWPSSSSPNLEPIFSQYTLGLFKGAAEEKDKRDLIVQELYSTEKQYVEALQMLVEKYMIPMKTHSVLDSNLIDDIFYKVNEIYMHHATFLTFLGKALKHWDNNSTIGDVIYKNFSKQTVIESYMLFIENFPRAEKVVDEISKKSSFQKFVELIEKENRMKLPLKAQIVKPAQRIPRYELLLKRLMDHTPEDHPDHELLMKAEKVVHNLALKINSSKESKQEENYQETLKKLELLLITDLISPDRFYIRHDMVQILNRKDQCCVWLFTDLAIFSSIKRKSGPVNRRTTLLLQSPGGHDFVENTKHKLWLKIPLEDLEIIKAALGSKRRELVDREQLEEDYKLLNQMADLSNQLQCCHDNLEDSINELISQVNRQLSQHQLKSPPPEANRVDLLATTTEGVASMSLVFPSPDKKTSWEAALAEAKQKLAQAADGRPPEYLQALQITKTRAGMQFSCAAPIEGLNSKQCKDVWVCKSDGYVGHMCLLSLQPEPIVTINTPVPGCNSRILCICAVPPFQGFKRKGSQRRLGVSHMEAPKIRIHRSSLDGDNEDGYICDSSSTSSESELEIVDLPKDIMPVTPVTYMVRSRSPSPLSGPSVQSPKESAMNDPFKSTMWLGTEDGCIHIFPSTENIKTTKNKVKLQQNAGVLSVVHVDHKVFVSLANGDLVVYKREEVGTWDTNNPQTLSLGTTGAPLNKMQAVAGKLWCARQNQIIVLNPGSLDVEVTFMASPSTNKSIQCMTSSGQGVWIATQGSAKVLLYHATTHELLLDISVVNAVAQKLQMADDIIRQHKTACLRITSLMTCKDLLWIGTSAGVILTLTMPKLSSTTTKSQLTTPAVSGLVYGHTGHVRFLSCVDMPNPHKTVLSQPTSGSGEGALPSWLARRASMGVQPLTTLATKMLVISGGDGFEDFRNNSGNVAAGKDDSTNHLLLWQV